jgi:hypothetical protein
MSSILSAIIFINDHTNNGVLNLLPTTDEPNPSAISRLALQLEINEIMSFHEFNARVAVDPNYPNIVHLMDLRILVVLHNFRDQTNRHLADIVIFLKAGLAAVERCKNGSPGFTIPAEIINIFNLIYGAKHMSGASVCLPCCVPVPDPCKSNWPPPLCPPQTDTAENPRPPEHLNHCNHPQGLGALELWGVEAIENKEAIGEGVFGDKLCKEKDPCCDDD